MKWLIKYRQHISAENPMPILLLILSIFRVFRVACFGLAALWMLYGVWVAFTEDMGFGGGMALILFPAGAFLISMVGAFAYAFAQMVLLPDPRNKNSITDA
ncbi:hypothetical protein [Sphingomonas lycopersici]|uniref:Uncharacterized protein n=1 Tax=Sphingomonas lycopersici TaxID=2951807 RepID=A0AA42CTD1_9SPHN|nr:hypothetical protein [Sphingomonas lycopersici]MCW6534288.1 hypothetical protein [Sphingomonas lycopersici]